MVMVSVRDRPGRSVKFFGLTVIDEPSGASALALKLWISSVTLVAVRVVTNRPGTSGAFTDGMLRWTAVSGSLAMAAKLSAVSLNVTGAALAAPMSIRPLPRSNGSAGVLRSSLTTSVVAVVMRADLIWPGPQSGWAALSSKAAPATCGDDIDVPAIAWNSSPGGL